MSDTEMNYEGIEQLPLKEFTEKAYLNYSMYVILDRKKWLEQKGDKAEVVA
jgi:topoisomerase-4 subunit A